MDKNMFGFINVEINEDQDSSSENFKEKYITISCINYVDGKPKVTRIVQSDRFMVEEVEGEGYKKLSSSDNLTF